MQIFRSLVSSMNINLYNKATKIHLAPLWLNPNRCDSVTQIQINTRRGLELSYHHPLASRHPTALKEQTGCFWAHDPERRRPGEARRPQAEPGLHSCDTTSLARGPLISGLGGWPKHEGTRWERRATLLTGTAANESSPDPNILTLHKYSAPVNWARSTIHQPLFLTTLDWRSRWILGDSFIQPFDKKYPQCS